MKIKCAVVAIAMGMLLGGTAHAQNFALPPGSLPLPLKKHVQRFLDSTSTRDYQCVCPYRTLRAQFRPFKYSSIDDRLYGIMGSSYFAYTPSQLLTGGYPMERVAGRINNDPGELHLSPSSHYYAESQGSGWSTYVVDGQQRLSDFDIDDRGYHYLAYSIFGWGILKDQGSGFQLVWHEGRGAEGSIACSGGACQTSQYILALRNGSQYYALVGGSGVWGLWDTTVPSAPVFVRAWYQQVGTFTRNASGTKVIITENSSTVRLVTPAQLATGNTTGTAVNLGSGKYLAAAANGEGFWLVPYKGGASFTIYNITSAGAATAYPVRTGKAVDYVFAYAGSDFLFAVDATRIRMTAFSTASGRIEEVTSITQFIDDYYSTAPGYVGHTGVLPLEYGGKSYFVWSAFGIADVYEVQAGDSISIKRNTAASLGTPNSKSPNGGLGPYYGDLLTFDVTFSGQTPPSSVNWGFGNPEAADNAASSAPNASVTHRYSGLSSASVITDPKIVSAVAPSNADLNDSISVSLLQPKARLLVPGSNTLVEGGSQNLGELVYGDVLYDASDGVIEGHVAAWTLDGVGPVTQSPSQGFGVGLCGVHSLTFEARYDSFPRSISALTYSVRPFVAAAEVKSSDIASVTFTNKTRYVGASFVAGATWTETWELVDSNGSTIGSPQTNTATIGNVLPFTVVKSSVPPTGGKVRLTISVDAASISDATCQSMVVDTFEIPLEKPDPVISTIQCLDPTTIAGSCTLSVGSAASASTSAWTYQWFLDGNQVSLQTASTYTPSFPSAATHTVTVAVSNPFGSTNASVQLDVTSPPCVGAPVQNGLNFSITDKGGRLREFVAKEVPLYYLYQQCDTFSWNFGDGTSGTGRDVVHNYTADGTYTATMTVSNVNGSASYSRSLTIGEVAPPPPPPPPPPTNSCPDATGKVFVGYSGSQSGCKPGIGSPPCNVGESVSFNVDTFGITLSSCHSVSWRFGDGATSSARTPQHTYQSQGDFSVRVTVSNGSIQASHSSTLSTKQSSCGTEPPSDLSIFHWGLTSGCKSTNTIPCKDGEQFAFAIQTNGGYSLAGCETIAWNFGDGGTASDREPRHTFPGTGPYTVSLRVTNTHGTHTTSSKVQFFNPNVPKPVVSVTPASTKAKLGTTITFVGDFTTDPDHPINAFKWRVIRMQGNTDTVVRTVDNEGGISHTFNTLGDYRVEFTATNEGGVSTPAVAYVSIVEVQEYSFLIPVVAHLQGNNGTQWRTDLQIFNTDPLKGPIEFEFEFKGGAAGISKTIVMTSSTQIYEDFLGELSKPFPALEDAGPVIVTARGDSPPQMWSRTYTVDSTGNGTYGQLIPAVSLDSSLESSEQTVKYVLPGLEISDRFRTNVGIVNPSSKTVTVNILARDDTTLGVPLGNFDIQVPPLALVQVGDLSNRIPGIDEHPFSLNIQPLGNTPVVVYGSMIDMNSNDPVYVTGIRDSDQEDSDKRVQILPGAGHLEQANGTWRSDVVVYNADLLPIKFDLIYYDGSGNKIAEAKDQVLGNGAFVKVEDVLAWSELDNSPGDSFGVIKIETNDSANSVGRYPIVFARTYKDRGELGSFGQGIPAISPNDANVMVDQPAFLAGIRSDCSYYTNLGLVNVGDSPSKVKVTLLDDVTGVAVGTWQYVVDGEVVGINPNSSLIATNIIRAISAVQSRGTLRIEVEEGGDVWAYASVIAAADPTRGCSLPEHTFDPEYIPAVKMPMP